MERDMVSIDPASTDDEDVGEIKSGCGEGEDGDAGGRGFEGYADETEARGYDEPDGVDRGVGAWVDASPEVRVREALVSREGEGHAGGGKHGGDAGEGLNENHGAPHEGCGAEADRVEKDLGDGHAGGGGDDVVDGG